MAERLIERYIARIGVCGLPLVVDWITAVLVDLDWKTGKKDNINKKWEWINVLVNECGKDAKRRRGGGGGRMSWYIHILRTTHCSKHETFWWRWRKCKG